MCREDDRNYLTSPECCYSPSLLKKSKGESASRLKRIHARDGDMCFWCNSRYACTVEHLMPRYCGGSDRLGNLKGSCNMCNHVRGDQLSGPDPKEVNLLLASNGLRYSEVEARIIAKDLGYFPDKSIRFPGIDCAWPGIFIECGHKKVCTLRRLQRFKKKNLTLCGECYQLSQVDRA